MKKTRAKWLVNRRNFNFFALNAFFFIKCDAKCVVDDGGGAPMVYTHYGQIWNVELDKTMAHLMLKVLLSEAFGSTWDFFQNLLKYFKRKVFQSITYI